jgi:hypothetical protein
MSEVIGVKHDGGKPWAGTVLAGFWPQLRGYFHDQAQDDGEGDLDNDDLQGWCEVLDVFFDVSLAVPDRFVKAAKHLTDHVGAAAYLPHVIDVGTYGARKYARDNWLHVEGGVERYYEAVGRHVRDVLLGDWRDEESGCVNLGHIAWGILAGAELVRRQGVNLQRQIEGRMHRTGQHINKGAAVAIAEDGLVYAIDTVVQPAPKLKLPLEVGKLYRFFEHGNAQGVFEAGPSGEKPPHDVEINGWYFDSETGEAPGISRTHRVEGPVEP